MNERLNHILSNMSIETIRDSLWKMWDRDLLHGTALSLMQNAGYRIRTQWETDRRSLHSSQYEVNGSFHYGE